jgi:hypothetical protein
MRASAFPFHLFAQAPAALDGQDRPPLSSNKDTRMDETALRRAEKMKRIKAARDAMMATKTEEQGSSSSIPGRARASRPRASA